MLTDTLYILAIIAQSISGTLAAKRREMDDFGILLIAVVSAFGGGTLRDILLNQYPISWIKDSYPIFLVIITSVITLFLFPIIGRLKKLFLFLDAFGLVSLTILGCHMASTQLRSLFLICLFGVITGVFGGILRDIFSNEIPLIFRKERYASISLATACMYVTFIYASIPSSISILTALMLGLVFRIMIIKKMKLD